MAYAFNEDKSKLEMPMPVEYGGTGATNASEALENLGIVIGTDAAPATGTPNTIYIQIV